MQRGGHGQKCSLGEEKSIPELYSGFLGGVQIEQFLELLIGPVFFLKAITRSWVAVKKHELGHVK